MNIIPTAVTVWALVGLVAAFPRVPIHGDDTIVPEMPIFDELPKQLNELHRVSGDNKVMFEVVAPWKHKFTL